MTTGNARILAVLVGCACLAPLLRAQAQAEATPAAPAPAPAVTAPACLQPPCPVTLADHFHSFTSSVFSWDTPVTPWILVVPLQHYTSHDGYRDGGRGYLNQYKVAMWDVFDFKFQRHFLYPELLHEDENYVPLGPNHPFGARLHHAVGHLFVTRSADHTHMMFNGSGIPASATTALVSNLYQPATLRTGAQFATNFGLNVGLRVFGDVFNEFVAPLF